MKVISVRELKNKLIEYICRVRLGSPSERGLLIRGASTGTDLYPALPRNHGVRRRSVAQLLDEERGSR